MAILNWRDHPRMRFVDFPPPFLTKGSVYIASDIGDTAWISDGTTYLQLYPAAGTGIQEYTWATKPPAAGNAGREIIVEDRGRERYRSNGVSWVSVDMRRQRATAQALVAAYRAVQPRRKYGSLIRPITALTLSEDIPEVSSSTTTPSSDPTDPVTGQIYIFGGKDPINWGTTPPTSQDIKDQRYICGLNETIEPKTAGVGLFAAAKWSTYNSTGSWGSAVYPGTSETWGIESNCGWRLSVLYGGRTIYLWQHSASDSGIAIYVDGIPVTPSSLGGDATEGPVPHFIKSPNGGRWVKIKFPSAKIRNLTISSRENLCPGAIMYEADKPIIGMRPRMRAAIFGTSFSSSSVSDQAGASTASDGWPTAFEALFGMAFEKIELAIGSSSLSVAATSGSSGSILPGGTLYTGRPASHRRSLLMSSPGLDLELIVLCMGHNDNTYHASPTFASEMGAFWRDARELHPGAILVLAGPDASPGTIAGGNSLLMGQTMEQMAAQHGVIFLPTQTRNPPLWSGTGKLGSENGSGTTDTMTGPDGTHPTAYGHRVMAETFADSLVHELARLA